MEFVRITGTELKVSRTCLGTWAIGMSNYSAEQMDIFRRTAPLHTCQPPYDLFERSYWGR